MADVEWQGTPERVSLRRALRHELRRRVPGLRVVAEDFLAESTRIDLLAVGLDGELVSLRIGREDEQAALFIAALADLCWLRPRALDLLKLAPGLGIEASTEPKSMIFCPRFSLETRLAAENLPPRSLELFEYRCLRQQGQLALLLEPTNPEIAARPPVADPHPGCLASVAQASPPSSSPRQSPPRQRVSPRPTLHAPLGDDGRSLTDSSGPSTFRTGLTDADLLPPRSKDLMRS